MHISRQEPPATDWIFFSSPRSLALYYKHYALGNTRIAVLGKGTYQMAAGLDLSVSFVPKSTDTDQVMTEFSAILKDGDSVLYPRGKQSLNRLSRALKPAQIVDFTFYDTISSNFPQATSNHLLFTSPSNVNAYFERYTLKKTQRAYAIGQTTADALKARGIQISGIAKEPGEMGFWDVLT